MYGFVRNDAAGFIDALGLDDACHVYRDPDLGMLIPVLQVFGFYSDPVFNLRNRRDGSETLIINSIDMENRIRAMNDYAQLMRTLKLDVEYRIAVEGEKWRCGSTRYWGTTLERLMTAGWADLNVKLILQRFPLHATMGCSIKKDCCDASTGRVRYTYCCQIDMNVYDTYDFTPPIRGEPKEIVARARLQNVSE